MDQTRITVSFRDEWIDISIDNKHWYTVARMPFDTVNSIRAVVVKNPEVQKLLEKEVA